MLYAIVDEDLKIARHLSKGKLAVFEDLDKLNKNAWRYMEHSKKYKVAELEFYDFFELDKKKQTY
ncbi:hypothetical protein [Vagococcus lutrae]|uniref:hypothetical protein n=1 Tax=Vagococcus lutrae TaxID=81947 RepID=UPI002891853C|nr:hypothetical protein [Vagococcus lutrae]MDT2844684.1 hypothetical protein [Vagococcus lutrae]